jgi:DNA-binding NtrC family response regulator
MTARLARHFLGRYGRMYGKSGLEFAHETLGCLAGYHWPGNVRELENEIQRLVLTSPDAGVLGPELLAPSVLFASAADVLTAAERPLRDIHRELEIVTIRARLERYGYQRALTARSLGITREALWAKLRRLGLEVPGRNWTPPRPRAEEEEADEQRANAGARR